MGKVRFRYGAMGASKSAEILMVKFNYEERGMKVLLLKPEIDTRDGASVVKSRIGLEQKSESAEAYLKDNDGSRYDCILVDEAQFLSGENVEKLADIADEKNIPVICYGLRTDFTGHLFEGSKRLMELADVIEEVPTICWCGKKAQFNARVCDGKVIKTGKQIKLGGNECYISLCRKHFKKGVLS